MKFSFKLFLSLIAAGLVLLNTSCGRHCDFGPEDWTHFIKKDSAKRWIKNYRAKYVVDSLAGPGTCTTNLLLLGKGDDFKFGKFMMGTMMCRKEVKGFRIYYGIKSGTDSIIPILVGISHGNSDVYWKRVIKTKGEKLSFLPPIEEEGAMDVSQKIPPPMSVAPPNMLDQ
jgi:hypothetical protein